MPPVKATLRTEAAVTILCVLMSTLMICRCCEKEICGAIRFQMVRFSLYLQVNTSLCIYQSKSKANLDGDGSLHEIVRE